MNWKLKKTLAHLAEQEISSIAADPHKQHKVGLMYPNTYFVGMSNLGMQIIYRDINRRQDSVCERYFLPDRNELKEYGKSRTPLMSIETQRPLYECDVIGVDMTFEMDYFNLPLLLRLGKVPVMAGDRQERDAYVIAGGPCATFNPEPFADFVDACVIGEGEGVMDELLTALYSARGAGLPRQEVLQAISQVPGIYVQSLYEPIYSEGRFQGFGGFTPSALSSSANDSGASLVKPEQIKRQWRPAEGEAETVIATDFTEFGSMYIVEVARGCGRHCRFCMAGYCYRRPRVRSLEVLKEGVDRAAELGKKVGLMGAAISDYPYIDELVTYIRDKGLRFSCASLRADSLTQAVVDGLAASGQQTITIAPEAGSERLRQVINKGIDEADLQQAIGLAAGAGIPHIRLYIMIGLPTETMEDIEALIDMAIRTRAHMEQAGCKGRLTLSINPFIPKPFTPFQWMAMADQKEISRKLTYIKNALKKDRRIEVLVESPRETYVQGVLSRGDRRLGAIIDEASRQGGGKAFKEACREAGYKWDDALYRERTPGEPQPWDLLDMGLDEGYLEREWQAGVDGRFTAPCADGCRRCGVCRE